jgi:hypothetical protein
MPEPSGRVRDSIAVWTEDDVQDWMAELGYPQYEDQIKSEFGMLGTRVPLINVAEHRISGSILSLLDHDYLKDIGVRSVGQRLTILKAVYRLKVEQDIPIEPDAYIPPCMFYR